MEEPVAQQLSNFVLPHFIFSVLFWLHFLIIICFSSSKLILLVHWMCHQHRFSLPTFGLLPCSPFHPYNYSMRLDCLEQRKHESESCTRLSILLHRSAGLHYETKQKVNSTEFHWSGPSFQLERSPKKLEQRSPFFLLFSSRMSSTLSFWLSFRISFAFEVPLEWKKLNGASKLWRSLTLILWSLFFSKRNNVSRSFG